MSGVLLETKKKIGSLRNTRKITKAMELVAGSKMKFFQKKAVNSRLFAWELIGILKANLDAKAVNPYMAERLEGKTVFILFTSDKGLCGALNGKMIKTLLHSREWKETPADERLLITLGKKSYEFARYNEIPVAKQFTQMKETMNPIETLELIAQILSFWENGTAKKVVMIAPHYKNAFTYYPIVKTFLPFSLENLQEHLGKEKELAGLKSETTPSAEYLLFDEKKEEVFDFVTREVIYTLFIQAFYELKATEYSSRMIAMKSATDAVDKIVGNLTLEMNKARQQVITTELADLVNASEAISSS